MLYNYEACARRGAELLDREVPDWWKNIDSVNMTSLHGHVLAQVFGDFRFGLEELFPDLDKDEQFEAAIEYGFDIKNVYWTKYQEHYVKLSKAWNDIVFIRKSDSDDE